MGNSKSEQNPKSPAEPGLLESALDILRQAVSGRPYASQAQLARATGESEANISRWLSGAATPTLRRLEPVLMTLGVRFAVPETWNDVPSPPQTETPPVPDNSDQRRRRRAMRRG